VEHRKADVRQVAGYAASGDDATRFLRELRQLRDGAGFDHAELAARAHYPYDVIKAAEVGPALPDLPVLCAYVRGCGGTTEEWEERWRSLTRSPSLPVSAARQSGLSDAATAGARISSATQVGDCPDPSIIIAALNRVAEEMASPSVGAVPASPVGQSLPDFSSSSGVEPMGSPDSSASRGSLGSVRSPAESGIGSKPMGWDPIRVSSAWPAIEHTPTVSGDFGSPETAAPWEAAPWAEDPLDAASTATWGPAESGTLSSAGLAGGAASGAAGAPATTGPTAGVRAPGGAPAPASGSVRSSSRTRTAVLLVVVLLCVLAVLLAIFA
jgi:hypothetical protein